MTSAAIIVFAAILGMTAFYIFLAYVLIQFIFKKRLKRSIERHQVIQMIGAMIITFIFIQGLRFGNSTLLLSAAVLLIALTRVNQNGRTKRKSGGAK